MNWHRAAWVVALSVNWPAMVVGAPPDHLSADIDIYPQVSVRDVNPQFVATALPPTLDKNTLKAPAVLAHLKDLGIKTVYFPTGCLAVSYNWASPAGDQLTVEEFLDFCEAIGAEPCYVLNMEGGTLGRDGPVPAGASVEERIGYRHAPPETCAGEQIRYGTLDEAVALVHKHTILRTLQGKRPLRRFVLGYEHWRGARSDWPPDVYGATCTAYGQAMLKEVSTAGEQQPDVAQIDLNFIMLGYPSPTGDPNPAQDLDRVINAAWTKEINAIAGLIEAAQEPLPALGEDSLKMYVPRLRRLARILAVRNGTASADAGPESDELLKYALPMSWVYVDENKPVAQSQPLKAASHPGSDFVRQLGDADLLSLLLRQSTSSVCAHDLIGDNPRALLAPNGDEHDGTRALRFLTGRIGEQLVRMDVETAAFNRPTPSDEHIPILSVTTTRRDHELYVILVNRATDRPVSARIGLRGCTVKPEGEVRTLSAKGIESVPLTAGNPLLHTVPPFSAQVLRLVLDQVSETPLLVSVEQFRVAARFGQSPVPDSFTLSIMAAGAEFEKSSELVSTAPQPAMFAIHADADWLEVSPPAGVLTFLQPQDIEITYQTERLSPGKHHAIITVLSPDAYNSPRKLDVDLTVRTVRADFDDDGDVDDDDLAQFVACMTAPPAVQAGPACAHARLRGDDHVDEEDFDLFEKCVNGPDRPPGPECAE